ncbi:hypothetical protein PMAYCL1PPCAC_18887, partial [Pristionchus mayeri]
SIREKGSRSFPSSSQGLSWLGFRPLPRLLFIGHFSSSLICSTLFALCYAYDVDRLSQNHANPCDYLLDMQFAFLARIFPVCSGASTSWFA